MPTVPRRGLSSRLLKAPTVDPLAAYENTGVNVGGQNAWGVVFTTDAPVAGVRIAASGHDTLSISTPIPEPSTLVLALCGLLGLLGYVGRRRDT